MTPDQVKGWRRELRAKLLAERVALDRLTILQHCAAIDRHLERGFPNLARGVVAFCWPYKNE
jgi:5-formyltetrahydrofolate cyclo-ligase